MKSNSEEKKAEEKRKELIFRLIKSGTPKQYLLFFKKYHEADIADTLETLSSEDRQKFFLQVNPEISAEILEEMDLDQQIEIISKFKVDVAAKFIEEMEPDDAVDLLEELQETNEAQAEQIIKALPDKEQNDIRTLLSYPEDSAGALMTPNFLSIPENLNVSEALDSIKKQSPPESELSFYIFVITQRKKLLGYTTMRDLLLAHSDEKIKLIRNNYPITIHTHDDQEEVAKQFQKYDMSVLPVVNDHSILQGVITVDDVVDVVVEEATEDIYKLTGTATDDEKDLLSGNIIRTLLFRLPWLTITIMGGIIASYIITSYSRNFDAHLFPLALSLSFIPLLMGLGGNVGNQSSAIIVRGLATGSVKPKESVTLIMREITIGIFIGSIIGIVIFLFNRYYSNQTLLFSSIVSISLICNITVATLIGSALPLLFNQFKIDPAVASAPFISTTLDIIGQIIYFSITLMVIQYLL